MGEVNTDTPLLVATNNDKIHTTPNTKSPSTPNSRQTRRLKIRNAKLRAPDISSRSLSPATRPTSLIPTPVDSMQNSDAENRSPPGYKSYHGTLSVPRSRSKGVLAEVGSSPNPKRTKLRIPSGRLVGLKNGRNEAMNIHYDPDSAPATTRTTPRGRNVKVRARMEKRRTISAEADKYIEQLEAELVTIQAHLTTINSDEAAREKGAHLRKLQSENNKLQQDLAEWEAKYEQTVQEQVAKHFEIESGLRLYIRTLEANAEEATFKSHELEQKLETTTKNLEAAETANVQLEKRIEIMSELLAESPTRIDLHTETGPRRRHMGTKSAMFRFPMNSMSLPPIERGTSPATSPQPSPLELSPTLPAASMRPRLGLRTICPLSDQASDAESIFSDAHFGEAVASPSVYEHTRTPSVLNSATLSASALSPKSKPVRRMRRFGAGSVKPKPLILSSSVSHSEFPAPTSSPAHERSTTIHEFPEFAWSTMSSTSATPRRRSSSTADATTQTNSRSMTRRRSSTEANEETVFNLHSSPFMVTGRKASEGFRNATPSSNKCPGSAESEATTREYASIGVSVGRNLLEELNAARVSNPDSSVTQSQQSDNGLFSEPTDCMLSVQQWTEEVEPVQQAMQAPTPETEVEAPTEKKPVDEKRGDVDDRESPTSTEMSLVTTSTAVAATAKAATSASNHKRSHSRHKSANHTLSTWQRLRILFGSLCKTPVDFARHLIQTAQTRMRIPLPLLSVNWWIVNLLLGPMARKRNLLPRATSECCARAVSPDRGKRSKLTSYTSRDQSKGLEYGTMWLTPPASPILAAVSGTVVRHNRNPSRCVHKYPQRHSPWLWLRFSFTLAFAVGIAFKDGPGSLMNAATAEAFSKRRPLSIQSSSSGGESGRQSPALTMNP